MKGVWAVCKRELKAYFTTPVAYVFLVVFLFGAAFLPFQVGDFYETRQADLRLFFGYLPMLLLFLAPAAAMRLWAEERRSGSIELLLTLPVTVRQVVIAKFLAAWAFLTIALLLTFPIVVTVWYLGDPDNGVIFCGYLGAFLMAGAFLAVECHFSALSKSQVISFILAVAVCALLVFSGLPSALNWFSSFLPGGLVRTIEGFSMQNHFESMVRGVIQLRDVVYFAALIVGWMAACVLVLDERRAA